MLIINRSCLSKHSSGAEKFYSQRFSEIKGGILNSNHVTPITDKNELSKILPAWLSLKQRMSDSIAD